MTVTWQLAVNVNSLSLAVPPLVGVQGRWEGRGLGDDTLQGSSAEDRKLFPE